MIDKAQTIYYKLRVNFPTFMSIKSFAKLLGLSQATVCYHESGKAMPDRKTFQKYLSLFDKYEDDYKKRNLTRKDLDDYFMEQYKNTKTKKVEVKNDSK